MASEDRSPQEVVSALRELVQCEGWKLFLGQLDDEWGPAGYGREIERLTSTVGLGPDRAYEIADAVERVRMTRDAVHQLRQWPGEEIRRLSGEKADTRRFAGLRRTSR